MPKSVSAKQNRPKPRKPSPSFPLTPHNNGQWCKKIRGKIHFFGTWEDPQGALDNYLRVAADLHAGREPRPTTLSQGAVTVKEVCNYYLTAQFRKQETGEITARWFEDCRHVVTGYAKFTDPMRCVSDLMPDDFLAFRQRLLRSGLAKGKRGLGVHALNRAITVIKGMFALAYDMDLIDRPVKFGKAFGKASKTQARKSRNRRELESGKRLFSPAEVRELVEAAETPLKAMILLGINGGFGNTDCADLPIGAVDLAHSRIDFARPKTGIERVMPLWAETRDALCEAVAHRPACGAKGPAEPFFLTKFGHRWVRENVHRKEDGTIEKVVCMNAVGQDFNKLLIRLGFKRARIGFYTLRHTFRTWADEAKDQHAVHRIMGHAITGMSGEYVEEISFERLAAVTGYVHNRFLSQEVGVAP